MLVKKYIIGIIVALSLVGCKKKDPIIISKVDSSSVIKLEFESLLSNLSKWQGKQIEVEGYFKYEFENVALYKSWYDYKTNNTKNALWTEFDERFIGKIKLENYNNESIKIKGFVNVKDKGHLGQYAGTIEKIFFIQ